VLQSHTGETVPVTFFGFVIYYIKQFATTLDLSALPDGAVISNVRIEVDWSASVTEHGNFLLDVPGGTAQVSAFFTGGGASGSGTLAFDHGAISRSALEVAFYSGGTYGIVWGIRMNGVEEFLLDANITRYDIIITYTVPTTTLSPVDGTVVGGLPFTITGDGFSGPSTVTFDGVPATSIVVVNATTITGVTPAHIAGPVDVVVTSNSVTHTLTDGFYYYNVPNLDSSPPWQTLGQWAIHRFDLTPRKEAPAGN
jgi:hypothetical protein